MLTLEADDYNDLHWCTDASFLVHPDMKSYTGSVFTLEKGCISVNSTKQKEKSRSATESELTAVDDKIAKVAWSKRFIECQGFKINLNATHQDNASTLKLINNGKISSGKRARNFDMHLFCVNDLI